MAQKRQQKRAPRGCSSPAGILLRIAFHKYRRQSSYWAFVVRHGRTCGAMFRIPFVQGTNVIRTTQEHQQKRAPRGCSSPAGILRCITAIQFVGLYVIIAFVVRHSRTGNAMFRIPFVQGTNVIRTTQEHQQKRAPSRCSFLLVLLRELESRTP